MDISHPVQTRQAVVDMLTNQGLVPVYLSPGRMYVYLDVPPSLDSPVQAEWYIEFRFASDALIGVDVQQRLVGP